MPRNVIVKRTIYWVFIAHPITFNSHAKPMSNTLRHHIARPGWLDSQHLHLSALEPVPPSQAQVMQAYNIKFTKT